METPDLVQSIKERLFEIREEERRLSAALGILEAAPAQKVVVRRRNGKRNSQTRDSVLAAVKEADGPLTATGVAQITGLERTRVSTMLATLAKDGELTKAAKGYTS